MGKTRVIAETGAGQHGVATATAAALMGMECKVFMGKEDTERQALNVFRMEPVSYTHLLEKPCILAEVGKGHYLLLDGNHRLRKAVREKLSCMICYCLKEEQHQKYIENYRQKEYERVMAGY